MKKRGKQWKRTDAITVVALRVQFIVALLCFYAAWVIAHVWI